MIKQSKRWADQSSQNQQEYEEITEKKKINAILEAQAKNGKSGNTKTQQKYNGKLQYFEDDREKKEIKYVKKQQNNRKESQNGDNKDKKYVQKNQDKARHAPKTAERKDQKYQQKHFVQKSQKIAQKEKKGNEEIKVQLKIKQTQFQNQIMILNDPIEEYLSEAKKIIKKYKFIVLKAYGLNVIKACLLSGLIAKQVPKMKQINIPRSVVVLETGKNGTRQKKRGAINIELSLHQLNKKHMGYQEWQFETSEPKKQQKDVKYKEKQEKQKPKYQQKEDKEKTSKYQEKDKRFKEKQYKPKYDKHSKQQIDERELR